MQVVVFTETNARVITNPLNEAEYKNNPRAVINPDLTHVQGVPPHFWKYQNNYVLPMDETEKSERLRALELDKNNTYTINEMFLRVSNLQNEVLLRDNEIVRLNDQYIEYEKQSAESIEKLNLTMINKIEEERNNHSINLKAFKNKVITVFLIAQISIYLLAKYFLFKP